MSRNDRERLSACETKFQYRSWQEAEKRMRGRHKKTGGKMVYHCKFCRWFHLAHAV